MPLSRRRNKPGRESGSGRRARHASRISDAPRKVLRELITKHGPGLAEDPRRLGALLRDTVGDNRREISLLVLAAEEGVGTDLLKSFETGPHEALMQKLQRRLESERALAPEGARWAVESWAEAVGLSSVSERETQTLDRNRKESETRHPPVPPNVVENVPARRSMRKWQLGGLAAVVAAGAATTVLILGSGPSGSEETLLSHIPSSIRSTCDPRSSTGSAIAEAECRPESETELIYELFPNDGSALKFYLDQVTEYGNSDQQIEADGATDDLERSCGSGGRWVEIGYSRPGGQEGRVSCFLHDFGTWQLLWWTVDSDVIVSAYAPADNSSSFSALQHLWEDAGPQ